MTEYEVSDLAFSKIFQIQGLATILVAILSSVGAAIQQYMTVLFAYIAAARFIGAKLETRQVVIFSTLYLVWQAWTLVILGFRSYGLTTTMASINELDETRTLAPAFVTQFITAGSVILLLFALFASLYFMWTVRHPKAE